MQIKWAPVSQSSTQSLLQKNSHGTYNRSSVSAPPPGGRAVLPYCLASAREMDVWNNRQVPSKSPLSAMAVSFEKEDFYSSALQPH